MASALATQLIVKFQLKVHNCNFFQYSLSVREGTASSTVSKVAFISTDGFYNAICNERREISWISCNLPSENSRQVF